MGFWLETLSQVEAIILSSRGKAFFVRTNNFIDTIELIVAIALLGGEVNKYILMCGCGTESYFNRCCHAAGGSMGHEAAGFKFPQQLIELSLLLCVFNLDKNLMAERVSFFRKTAGYQQSGLVIAFIQ